MYTNLLSPELQGTELNSKFLCFNEKKISVKGYFNFKNKR